MLNNTENYSISFPEFVKALENSMDENGFLVSLYCANSVYEVYNEKTGKFTKYISEIRQIYTP